MVSNARSRQLRFQRSYPNAEVFRYRASGERWSGLLTVPKEGGAFPAVVLSGGWGDGPLPLISALIARRGFAVLDVGYHGWEGLPEELVGIPIESVTDAIDWLVERPEVSDGAIGLFGFSRGAELGLLAATRDPRIVAAAAWAPSSEVFPGISFRSARQRSSWSWRGKPVAFTSAPPSPSTPSQ